MSRYQGSASASAEELEELVAVAFGPDGRAVMVQQPTGQFHITRSGYSILTSVYPEPDAKEPTRHILIDCAKRVHESLGDGVKSFLIMTSSLLKYCGSLGNPTHIARQLGALEMQLNLYPCQKPELPIVDDKILKKRIVCFEIIIETFFFTRFPASVSNALSKLLCQWILSNMSSTPEFKMQSYSQHVLQNLLRDFSMLCQYKNGGSRSVSESCVQRGYRVCRPAINLSMPGPHRIQFLMLGDSDSSSSGCFDDVDIQSEVEKFLLSLESRGCEEENILLVTSAILSDLALFRLRRRKVAVLQGILPEEVGYLYSALFRLQQDGSREIAINVKLESECTWLEVPNVYQLLLHAPTSELSTEYACSCQSAIKLCIVAASYAVMPNFSPCVTRAGGSFERALQMQLALKSKMSLHDPLVCGVASRAELLEWHKQRQMTSENFQNPIIGIDTHRKNSGNQIKQGETIEQDQNIVDTLSAVSFDSIPNVGDSFAQSCNIDEVLCSVDKACAGLDADVVGAIVRALLAMQRRLPKHDMIKKCSGFEPVGLRLCILQHSLRAVSNLLRVCGTLEIRKKLPSKGSPS